MGNGNGVYSKNTCHFLPGIGFWLTAWLLVPLPLMGEKSARRVQVIDGKQYTVEYRLNDDQSLSVTPTHIWTTGGWSDLGGFVAPTNPIEWGASPKGSVVEFEGRKYAVQFASSGVHAQARAYARFEDGQWKNLPAAKPSAQSPKVKGPGASVPKTAAPRAVLPQAGQSPGNRSEAGAEFRLYEPVVSRFKHTTRMTTPFYEDGNLVRPDMNIGVSAQITDSNHALGLRIGVDVAGTASSTGGRYTLGRYTGATVDSSITGRYTRDLHATHNGVTAQPLRGGVSTSYGVTTTTEMRLLRRMAHRKARQEANASARRKIPQKEREIEQKVRQATSEAVDEANLAIRKNLNELSGLTEGLRPGPFEPRYASVAGRSPGAGFLSVGLADNANGTERAPRPPLKQAAQTAASLFVHEDVLTQAIAPNLAGKEISLREALETICKHSFSGRLDICTKTKDAGVEDVKLKFDATDPFRVRFRNGTLTLELNASHQKAADPASGMPAVSGSPQRIEIEYEVSPTGLKRKPIRVAALTSSGSGSGSGSEKSEKDSHGGGVLSLFSRATRFLADPVEQQILKESYAKAFKEELVFPVVRLPVSAAAVNPGPRATPQVTGYVNLGPLDAQSVDGWLGFSSKIQ